MYKRQPQTWRSWVFDAEGDGTTDPQNFYDAAVAAFRRCQSPTSARSAPAHPARQPVSYTHLDVYKRQALGGTDFRRALERRLPGGNPAHPPQIQGIGGFFSQSKMPDMDWIKGAAKNSQRRVL